MTRAAVVTGAARGIGAATVTALAAAGWNVVALDRCADDPRLPYRLGTERELTAVVEQARATAAAGAGVRPLVGDASSTRDMAEAVSYAERAFGGVDGIVAVAGVIAGGVPLWEMSREQQEAVLEGNLQSVLVAARVGIPALLRRPEPRSGRFVAVASAAATRGLPMLAAYCAAKAGVTGLVRALAAELRGTGVTANAVSPGSTATPAPRRERAALRPGVGRGVLGPAAARAAHPARGGGRRDRVADGPGRVRRDRRRGPGGRRPLPLSNPGLPAA